MSPAQAFRHLYVLAAVPRCLEAVDVSTGQPVQLPLRMTLRVSGYLVATHDVPAASSMV